MKPKPAIIIEELIVVEYDEEDDDISHTENLYEGVIFYSVYVVMPIDMIPIAVFSEGPPELYEGKWRKKPAVLICENMTK